MNEHVLNDWDYIRHIKRKKCYNFDSDYKKCHIFAY